MVPISSCLQYLSCCAERQCNMCCNWCLKRWHRMRSETLGAHGQGTVRGLEIDGFILVGSPRGPCTLSTLYIVHPVHCPPCTLSTLYIVHPVHPVHCPPCTLSTLYIVHPVHCPPCTLSTLYIVHPVHCPPCTLSTLYFHGWHLVTGRSPSVSKNKKRKCAWNQS